MHTDPLFHERLGGIEQRIQALEELADPAVRSAARDIVQAVLELHRVGLEKLLEIFTGAGEPGRSMLSAITDDDLLASLLLLHGLHPVPVQERVQQALAGIAPFVEAQGGEMELLQMEDGVARLRLRPGSMGSAPLAALRAAVESALVKAAPDLATVEFEDGDAFPKSRLIPLSLVQAGNNHDRARE